MHSHCGGDCANQDKSWTMWNNLRKCMEIRMYVCMLSVSMALLTDFWDATRASSELLWNEKLKKRLSLSTKSFC